MFLYSYAIVAIKNFKNGYIQSGVLVGAITALNEEQAYKIGMENAKGNFPGYANWTNHEIYLYQIPEQYVNQSELCSG